VAGCSWSFSAPAQQRITRQLQRLKMCTWDQKHQNIRSKYNREQCHRNRKRQYHNTTLIRTRVWWQDVRTSRYRYGHSTAEGNKATAAASENVQHIRTNYVILCLFRPQYSDPQYSTHMHFVIIPPQELLVHKYIAIVLARQRRGGHCHIAIVTVFGSQGGRCWMLLNQDMWDIN
jgi:hypothetical protein